MPRRPTGKRSTAADAGLSGGDDAVTVDGVTGDYGLDNSAYGNPGDDRVHVQDIVTNDVGDGGPGLADSGSGGAGELVDCK